MKTISRLFTVNTLILLFLAIIFSPLQAQSFLTNGLVTYYPFSGNANDASGNGNHGLINGATLITNRFGQPNSAFNFNGVNSQIVATNSAFGWPNGNSPRTVSLWLLSAQGNGNLFTMGAKVSSGDFCIEWPAAGGPVCFVGWENDYCFSLPSTTNWIHFALTYDGTNGIAYGNGVKWAEFQISLNTVGAAPLFIGADLDSVARNGGFFGGQLDDVRVYNRALSSSEVERLYIFESAPVLNIRKAVYLDSSNLWPGTNYQLQVSTDLSSWTNYGSVFTVTNSTWRSTNYWDVDNWDQLFFRLHISP